jgi:hypothetical protein
LRSSNAGGYFGRGIATAQAHKIKVYRFRLVARRISMVIQKTMKTELDSEALKTIAAQSGLQS